MLNGTVFLERQGYRRRRMMDAIRFMPFLGVAIFMVPLLWPQPVGVATGVVETNLAETGLKTSVALRYLFGGWIALVCIGWLLWARTRNKPTTAQQP